MLLLLLKKMYQKNIYKYAMTFGNYGFMGNFIILGVWGDEILYKYLMFTFFIGVACYSWGLYILVSKDQNSGLWNNLKKGFLTPPIFALVIGIVCGLLNIRQYMPDFIMIAFENAAKCQGPIAMLLAGFVIGGYNLKELLLNKKVYIATCFRLIVIPTILLIILRTIGATEEVMILAFIAFATPVGLNTIVYPAAYSGDVKTGASMATISHTLSVITIPLLYFIFFVM